MTHVTTCRRKTAEAIAVLAAFVALTGALTLVFVRANAATADPPPTVRTPQLAAALHCSGHLSSSPIEPVLFIHGTTSNSDADFSWNWNRAFAQRRWAYCDVDLPESGNGDIQTSAEYVTYAIRTMFATAHRRIGIVGHSQGGMIGRWALKYWPETRAMVSDYVGLAASNHGTSIFNLQCSLVGCSAANWQQARNSRFLTALNRGPQTFAGIDYTEIATREDEIVVPYTSPFLPAAANVTNMSVQQLCPLEVVDHLGLAYDNAAWLIGLDALTHSGPAKPSRISRATCGAPFLPGVDPLTFPTNVAKAIAQLVGSTLRAPILHAEPAVRSYAR